MNKEEIQNEFEFLQSYICSKLEEIDGNEQFQTDIWERNEGGGGKTKTITNGAVIEKGGVAFSAVFGPISEMMQKEMNMPDDTFFATGVSIVLHPKNPFVPIIHMNVRYFELSNGTYWFGGGIDLTPHYVDDAAAHKFHVGIKETCDMFHPDFYTDFKKAADDYFYLPHRDETRGIGGIFFDRKNDNCGLEKNRLFEFCVHLCKLFPKLYAEQVSIGKNKSFTDENLKWMKHRRGRYAEFNLAFDKGTKFGLVSGGRTESILMSLPPEANWTYCQEIHANSEEEKTLLKLTKGIDWINIF